MKFIFDHRNRKTVYCIRAGAKCPERVEITALPSRGIGYHLYPEPGDLAGTLLRDIGASGLDGERVAALLAITARFQRQPPWETCESDLRLFCDGVEAFR